VHERSGDKPFARIEDVVSAQELARISNNYRQVAGFAQPSAPIGATR
jgi:5-methylphenazine-1-carboxylate 1-monooxygenase